MEQSVMPSLTTINLTCTLGYAALSNMTILETDVAKLSVPHYLNTLIKGLSCKVLTFHQKAISVTGRANTDLRI